MIDRDSSTWDGVISRKWPVENKAESVEKWCQAPVGAKGKRECGEAEARLPQEQAFMRGVLDHLGEGVSACNEQGELIYSNRGNGL